MAYKTCHNCGAENSENAVFCIRCGERLEKLADETVIKYEDKTVKPSKDSHSKNLWIQEFRGYTVLKQFPASGAEADTFLIEQDNKQFFLKLYRQGMEPKIEVLQKIKSISQKLREHVVVVYDVGFDEETERYFEIMEYVQFGSLKELISYLHEQPDDLRKEMIERIVSELSEAINALHSEGIVHRDLKPSNVLIRSLEPLNLILTDFGISLQMSTDVSKIYASSFKGTPAYIAPEEISNYFGKEIDWWHLGIIMYELLLGKNPFAGTSEQVIVHRLVTRGVEIPEEIGERYKTLLKGLLTRDRKKRWGYEQVRLWLMGEKDIPVYYNSQDEVSENNDVSESVSDLKDWIRAGFTEQSAKLWSKTGLTIEEALDFKENFSYSEAISWINAGFRNATLARKWYDSGISPEEAGIYENFGINPKDASYLINHGITAYDLQKAYSEGKISPERFTIGEISEYIDAGFNPFKESDKEEIERWKSAGFSLKEIGQWRKAGFSLREAKEWVSGGISFKEALEWKKRNISFDDAVKFLGFGFTPKEAEKIPTRYLNGEFLNEWKKKGIEPRDAIIFSMANVELSEAAKWVNAGFTVEEALAWRSKAFKPKEAKQWKYYGFEPTEAREWYNKGYTNPKKAKKAKESTVWTRILDVIKWIVIVIVSINLIARCFIYPF
jgi:serine/threonine protein kinase